MTAAEHLAQADGVAALFRASVEAANALPPAHRIAVLAAALDDLVAEIQPTFIGNATANAISALASAAHHAALATTATLAIDELRSRGVEPPGLLLNTAVALRARTRANLAQLPPAQRPTSSTNPPQTPDQPDPFTQP
ncbi:MAG TPA: hypothetical protein DCS97_00090 [Planctomycetes bacterium]|nr:hypothetical protein [Planctomycetota bacterium]